MDKLFYVYILECCDNSFYTGYTIDLANRLKTHNSKRGAKYTRSRTPVKMIYAKAFISKSSATSFEAKIKQLTRKNKEKLVSGDNKIYNNLYKKGC